MLSRSIVIFLSSSSEIREKTPKKKLDQPRNFVLYTPFIVVVLYWSSEKLPWQSPNCHRSSRAKQRAASKHRVDAACDAATTCLIAGDVRTESALSAEPRTRTTSPSSSSVHPSPSIPRCICPRVDSLPGGDSIRDSYRSRGFAPSHYSRRIMCAKQKSQKRFHRRKIRNYASIRNIYM